MWPKQAPTAPNCPLRCLDIQGVGFPFLKTTKFWCPIKSVVSFCPRNVSFDKTTTLLRKILLRNKKRQNTQSTEEQEYLKTIIHTMNFIVCTIKVYYHSWSSLLLVGGPTGGKWENYHSRSARSSQPSGVRGFQNPSSKNSII